MKDSVSGTDAEMGVLWRNILCGSVCIQRTKVFSHGRDGWHGGLIAVDGKGLELRMIHHFYLQT
jgi:hypothetical protein